MGHEKGHVGFFAKHKKKILYSVLAFALIVLIFYGFRLTLKVNYILGDDLVITLEPQEASISLKSDETREVQFRATTNNLAYCTASCTYRFIDKSQNKVLDSGNVTLRKKDMLEKSYALSKKRQGAGQEIYRFEMVCHNMRTYFCLTGEEEKSRTALITVNYELSDDEAQAKEFAKEDLTSLLMRFAEIDVQLHILNERILFAAQKIKATDLLEAIGALEAEFGEQNVGLEGMRTLWGEESYLELQRMLLEGDNAQRMQSLSRDIIQLNRSLDGRWETHKGLAQRLNHLVPSRESVAQYLAIEEDEKAQEQLAAYLSDLSRTMVSLETLGFEQYGAINETAKTLGARYRSINQSAQEQLSQGMLRASLLIALENNTAQIIRGFSQEPSPFARMLKEQEGTRQKEFRDSDVLSTPCDAYENLTAQLQAASLAAQAQQMQFAEGVESRARMVKANISLALLDEWEAEMPIQGSFAEIVEEVREGIKAAQTPLTEQEVQEAIGYLRRNLTPFDVSAQFFSLCETLNRSIVLPKKIETQIVEPKIEAVSNIVTELSDNPPQCCILGVCKPCCNDAACKNDPKTFPIIFLHGHAFSKSSAPAYSVDAFNKIQRALDEEGYLNAGFLTPQSSQNEGSDGEWGLSGRPITVKATYYLDAVFEDEGYIIVPTKSESIDTYALRLHDIITTVQDRTGKEKVNVIAHSMGGLVARRYMQIYGDSEVEKLIMIGTPNKGIVGKTNDYCQFFGEKKECEDMQEESIFIRKLNDPQKQPKNAKLYVIAGSGCETAKQDSDGIVVLDHAMLEGAEAFTINGTCGGLFDQPLHAQMLDTDKYPKTIEIIKEILKE